MRTAASGVCLSTIHSNLAESVGRYRNLAADEDPRMSDNLFLNLQTVVIAAEVRA